MMLAPFLVHVEFYFRMSSVKTKMSRILITFIIKPYFTI